MCMYVAMHFHSILLSSFIIRPHSFPLSLQYPIPSQRPPHIGQVRGRGFFEAIAPEAAKGKIESFEFRLRRVSEIRLPLSRPTRIMFWEILRAIR